jgi:hypothetical protein
MLLRGVALRRLRSVPLGSNLLALGRLLRQRFVYPHKVPVFVQERESARNDIKMGRLS